VHYEIDLGRRVVQDPAALRVLGCLHAHELEKSVLIQAIPNTRMPYKENELEKSVLIQAIPNTRMPYKENELEKSVLIQAHLNTLMSYRQKQEITHVESRLRAHFLDVELGGYAELLAPVRRSLNVHEPFSQSHVAPANLELSRKYRNSRRFKH
jgi:hypothetical protein